ncbi:peptidoglycan-binding protein [Streptomyces sp. NPDC057621]|uniref:Peptidoglycan-binding protein n=1 Tax=Streptomyces liliiviolaceus TaxID=2823109 RepID=A0A941BIC3_9ACTN|nr:peptidoglycan-binding domain-containing protein [Streptomyces liliiviolaceus]MBQ0854759.1 peptidoglycan-binding protein [Streptomyces liliiviolaceus]
MNIRSGRAKSAAAAGALLVGLLGGALAGAPSAAAATSPCSYGANIYNKVTNPTSYKYIPYSTIDGSNCWLDRGMSNTAVRALQKNLNSCYGYNLVTDGDFGPLTESALITVQKKVGVTADGDYGPKTRSSMVWGNYSVETGARISCN